MFAGSTAAAAAHEPIASTSRVNPRNIDSNADIED